jgi:hypothetical protein
MRNKGFIGVAIIGLAGFLSCDTEPELEFGVYEPKLVIDGWIEQGNYPKVILTSSMSYFNALDSATVRKLVITTAKVTVSDGVNEEVLTLEKNEDYFPPYVYTGTDIRGEIGKTYTLTVQVKGESYSATTTIPPVAEFDDLWYESIPEKDTLGYIYGKFTDDPAVANYYRVFTQRENKDTRYVPVYLSAIGDQSFNGKSFTFSLLRGPDNFTNVVDDLYFEKGDTIKVKFCTMDKAHFDFWRTLERELYVVGNPFASSGNDILSNFDNKKALGVWGGYGVKYYRLIAQ